MHFSRKQYEYNLSYVSYVRVYGESYEIEKEISKYIQNFANDFKLTCQIW